MCKNCPTFGESLFVVVMMIAVGMYAQLKVFGL